MKSMLRNTALFSTLLSCSALAADDPWLWLEEVDSKRAISWVEQQNAVTDKNLKNTPLYRSLYKDALAALESTSRLPEVDIKGSWVYQNYHGPDNPRGLYRRMSVAEFNAGKDSWQNVLDIDKLSEKEGKKWVLKGMSCEDDAQTRCLLSLSPGGGDAVELREFNPNSGSFVDGGFYSPVAKHAFLWLDENTLLIGTDFDDDSRTDSGYARHLRAWTRGTALKSAKPVFSVDKKSVWTAAETVGKGDSAFTLIQDGTDFWNRKYYRYDGNNVTALPLPTTTVINGAIGEQLIANLFEDWQHAGKTWKAGTVLAIRFSGEKISDVEAIFKPSTSSVVDSVTVMKDSVLLTLLDQVRGKAVFAHPGKDGWKTQPVDFPDNGQLGVSTYDSDSGMTYIRYEDFITPPTLYSIKPGQKKPQKIASQAPTFDGSPYEVKQFFVDSKDGTSVPYFVVMNKKTRFDGSNPTHIFSYGGFRASLLPSYSGSYEAHNGAYGKLWLDRGGVFVLANIRGGAEFGPDWHAQSLRENRLRSYEDFEAIAEDLIARKITSASKLSIEGRSNGGLLVGATMTRRPDLYNAVICGVPLLDMKRYHTLLAGASWMGEYGNPDTDDWNFIRKYSPYQNLKKGVDYPQIFFYTSTRDDRVHPGHARKMAAKMKAMGQPVEYYENLEGGHGGSVTHEQTAHRIALSFTHLWNALK